MTFSNRTFSETLADMLTAFAAAGTDVTDLLEGSVATTLMESMAVVSQQIEEDIAARLDADIATSAYRSFNFSLLPDRPATGSIQVFPTDLTHRAITIPVSTPFVVPGTNLRYLSQFETVLLENAPVVTVAVIAETPGTISNVPAGSVTQLASGIAGIGAATNPYPFVNGRDAETDIERRVRFQRAIAQLHYGTTNAIEAGIAEASTIDAFGVPQERIGRVRVDESAARLTVYITNDSTLTTSTANYPYAASSDLVAVVQQLLDGKNENGIRTPGFKAAGVTAVTFAAVIKPIAINLSIRPSVGYPMTLIVANLQESIQLLFNRLNIGDPLDLQALRRVILTTRGIDDYVLGLPTINVTAETNQIITLIPFEDVSANPPVANDITRSWIQRL